MSRSYEACRGVITDYVEHDDYHLVKVTDSLLGETKIRVDLFVNGDFPEDTDPRSIIGKTVEWEDSHPYILIAHGVEIIDG